MAATANNGGPAPAPFQEFFRDIQPQSPLRAHITRAYRQPETECLPAMLTAASLPPADAQSARALARELVVALRRKKQDGGELFDEIAGALKLEIVPVTAEQAKIAREAYRRFGKGRHKARLTFGDCFAYAAAKELGAPLLFKGNDFVETDLERA